MTENKNDQKTNHLASSRDDIRFRKDRATDVIALWTILTAVLIAFSMLAYLMHRPAN